MSSYFGDLPCGANCLATCPIKDKMTSLQESLVQCQNENSKLLIRAFLTSYRALCMAYPKHIKGLVPDVALPALFDLLASAKYAEKMMSDGGWTYCAGAGEEQPYLYFPFLKTCPRCSVQFGVKPLVKSNKPGSDAIGEMSGNATIEIISEILALAAPQLKIGKSSARQGDVDMVMYDDSILVLAEIKSSPLVVYPIESPLGKKMTETKEGVSQFKRDHTEATLLLDQAVLFMYLPHVNERIPLGQYNHADWPYAGITDYLKKPENVKLIISAWRDLYEVYSSERRGRSTRQNVDNRKWLTCGCGGSVDDSKNAPGLDRTDDIKKGTYQVLKFGTYYKEKCPRRSIRSALISNFLAVNGFDRYLLEVQDVIWTKDKYSISISSDHKGVRAFREDSVFNLYDALLCLTRSIYQDTYLKDVLSVEKVIQSLCQ